ncbi:MAG: hypothetical protein ACFFDK_16420 [Promethearchaeota archaeon]
MNELKHEKARTLEERYEKQRRCSEIYSCTEDFSYFLTLALPFAN